MNSIVTDDKKCYECGSVISLHNHHIIFGTAKRKQSEKYGLKVWLCQEHHSGTNGVHGKKGHELDIKLKKLAQKKFEEFHTREDFISMFGRNYL